MFDIGTIITRIYSTLSTNSEIVDRAQAIIHWLLPEFFNQPYFDERLFVKLTNGTCLYGWLKEERGDIVAGGIMFKTYKEQDYPTICALSDEDENNHATYVDIFIPHHSIQIVMPANAAQKIFLL